MTGAAGRRTAVPLVGRLALLTAASLGAGAVAGAVWSQVVDLPSYRVNADGGASTTERGLTQFFSGDAWFCLLGALVGLGLGTLTWRASRQLGWPLVVIAGVLAVAAALVCWLVGTRLGPGNFASRLAAARPGDLVSLDLTLRARAALLSWPFFAVIPVLLASSLGREEETNAHS